MSGHAHAYRGLLRNRTFVLLWSGQTISGLGDALFNIAIMWLVYVRTGSALQTGIINVMYQLSAVFLAPLGGVYADRWDRKRTMIAVSFLSALIVAIAAVPLALGRFSVLMIYGTVLALSVISYLYNPAYYSVVPEVVGTDLLATANGLSSATGQGASLLGSALAGVILAVLGAAWALIADAISFVLVGVAVAMAAVPGRPRGERRDHRTSIMADLREGWQAVQGHPVTRALVWLFALVNVVTLGALFPALVRVQLHGDARVYGALEAFSVVGGVVGALAAGYMERRVGAGRLMILGFVVAGLALSAMGLSTSVVLTGVLEVAVAFWLVASNVATGSLYMALIPNEVRGRASGLLRAVAVLGMPPSVLIGGWAVDRFGPGPIFVVEGLWAVGIAVLAWTNRHVRTARIGQQTAGVGTRE